MKLLKNSYAFKLDSWLKCSHFPFSTHLVPLWQRRSQKRHAFWPQVWKRQNASFRSIKRAIRRKESNLWSYQLLEYFDFLVEHPRMYTLNISFEIALNLETMRTMEAHLEIRQIWIKFPVDSPLWPSWWEQLLKNLLRKMTSEPKIFLASFLLNTPTELSCQTCQLRYRSGNLKPR